MTKLSGRDAREALLDDVLATTESRLRFVVARRRLATTDAVSLRAGQVLTFDSSVPPAVELVVDTVTVARGELVDVEGQRGVRVIELAELE